MRKSFAKLSKKGKLEHFIKGHGHYDYRFHCGSAACKKCPVGKQCTYAFSMDVREIEIAAAKRYEAAVMQYAEKFGEDTFVALVL